MLQNVTWNEVSRIKLQEKLKLLREKRQLLQRDVAAEMGVSRGLVALWESGRRKPDAQSTARLARFLGVTTDYLIGWSDEADRARLLPEAGEALASKPYQLLDDAEMDLSSVSPGSPRPPQEPGRLWPRASASASCESPYMESPAALLRETDQYNRFAEVSESDGRARSNPRLEVQSMLRNLDDHDMLIVRDMLRAVFRERLRASAAPRREPEGKDPGAC
jgi:transcriptional regulator with XRE-family HTH domain